MIHVQFTDATRSSIAAAFSCPQDPEVYENLGQVAAGDSTWITYINALPPSLREWGSGFEKGEA